MQKSLDSNFLIRLFHLQTKNHAFQMLRSPQANCYFRTPRFKLFQKIQEKFRKGENALFYNILYGFKIEIIFGGLITILLSSITLTIPVLLKSFMNYINNQNQNSQQYDLGKNFFQTFLIVQLLRIIVAHHSRRTFHEISIKVQSILCKKLVTKSFQISRQTRQSLPTSTIVNLLNIDSRLAAILIKKLYIFFEVPFTFIVSIILLFNIKDSYGFIGIYWFIIAILIQYQLNVKMAHCNQTKLRLIVERSKNNIEIMQSIKQAKIIGWQDVLIEKNNEFFQEENADHCKFYRYSTLYDITVLLLPLAVAVSICLFNAIKNVKLPVVQIYSILALLNICIVSSRKMRLLYITLHDGLYSFRRFQSYFDIPNASNPKRFSTKQLGQQALVIKAQTKAIYKSEDVQYQLIVNQHIQANGGQRILILGRKNQGQSLLIHLLLGRLKTQQGYARVNGTISYMPKDKFFIRQTVYQNIRFYDNTITDQEIQKFAIHLNLSKHHKKQELKQFLNKKMDEVDTFTKSQLAKISLIRTIIRKADVYILNEPFEELSSQQIRYADIILRKLQNQGKLIIIAPCTLNYISENDKIIIVECGQITQFGTLQKLSKNTQSNIRNFVTSQDVKVDPTELDKQEVVQQAQKGISKLKEFLDKKRIFGMFRKNAQMQQLKEKEQSQHLSQTFQGQIIQSLLKKFDPQPYLRKKVQWHLQERPSPISLDMQKKFAACLKQFIKVVPFSEIFFILLVIAAAEFLHVFIHYQIGHIDQHSTFSENTKVICLQLSLTIGLAFILFYEGQISSIISIVQGNVLYENSLKTLIYKNLTWLRNEYPIRLAQKFNKDYEHVFIACHKLLGIYKNFIILGITVYFIIQNNIVLIGLFMLIVAIYLTIFVVYKEIQSRVFQYHYVYGYRLLKIVEESFQGAQVFISFDKTSEHIKRAEQQFKISCSFKLAIEYNRSGLDIACDLIGAILLIVIISQGTKYKSSHQNTNLPLMAISLNLLMNGSKILKNLVKDCINFKSFFSTKLIPFISLHKQQQIKKYQSAIKDKTEKTIHAWSVNFNHINLACKDDKIKHSPLDLHIKQGQTVLIYELEDICRQYILLSLTMNLSQIIYPNQYDKGKITIGQTDITKICPEVLKKNVGVIAKKNFYISGSIRENICRKCQYSDSQMIQYIKLVKLHLDFQNFDKEMLDTKVQFKFGKINHEITKKLALIRALLRKPKIIILYDTTIYIENIDVVQLLKKLVPGCTIICLSNIIQNYTGFERIVYMKNFNILEDKKIEQVVDRLDTLIGRIIKNTNVNAYNYMNQTLPQSKFRKQSL